MSPEQVRGEASDHRADIFSFGAILYEMVTGRRAFCGESAADTSHAIMKEEPPGLDEGSGSVPAPLRILISQCLAKRAEERFQSAHDLFLSLSAIPAPGAMGPVPSAAAPPPARWAKRRSVWLVALASFGVITASAVRSPKRPAPAPVLRFFIEPPPKAAFATVPPTFHVAAISPDGRQVALVAERQGKRLLWVRPLDALIARPLAGTEGGMSPFWSPDSRQIGFFADGKMKKIDARGAAPTVITEAGRNAGSATWSREGTILFTSSVLGTDNVAIYRVSDSGGEPAPVTTRPPARNEGLHAWPTFLPDGHHFLYLECNQPADIRRASVNINVGALGSRETRHLIQAESRVAFADGFLLYVRDGVLLAHPFDPESLRFTGEPAPVVDRVSYFASGGYASFSVSETGVLVYGAGEDVARLTWFDRRGRAMGSVGEPADYQSIRSAPDGNRSAVTIADRRTGTTDLWTIDLARGTGVRLTADSRMEINPIWSPDGTKIIFAADRGAPPFLHVKDLSRAGEGLPLTAPGAVQQPADWSPDGRHVLYTRVDPMSGLDLWLLPIAAGSPPSPWLISRFQDSDGRFSPDGRFIAYVSDESGRPEVYVQPFELAGEKQRVSTAGGELPVWRRDGKELFYLSPTNTLMAVPVVLGSRIAIGEPTDLFDTTPSRHRAYDVSPDGQRFLIATAEANASSTPLTVVINWPSELAERASTSSSPPPAQRPTITTD
jgi:Tol biopolymer transport system component